MLAVDVSVVDLYGNNLTRKEVGVGEKELLGTLFGDSHG